MRNLSKEIDENVELLQEVTSVRVAEAELIDDLMRTFWRRNILRSK